MEDFNLGLRRSRVRPNLPEPGLGIVDQIQSAPIQDVQDSPLTMTGIRSMLDDIVWEPRIFTPTGITYSYENPYTDMKKCRSNPEMVTLHTTKKEVKFEDAVWCHWIDGYFMKDDKDIVKDPYSEEVYINLNKKYRTKYSRLMAIYTDIDDNGNFINPVYSVNQEAAEANLILSIDIKNPLEYELCADIKLLHNAIFKEHYKENIHNGVFYHNSTFKPEYAIKSRKAQYRKTRNSLGYAPTYKEGFKPTTYINTFGKKYSFGFEIETSSGYLPTYLDRFLDYTAVHDGSLRDEDGNTPGGEYVTGVLRGDKGLYQLKLLNNELSKRCMLNKLCGVHTHIGDVNFSKENVVLMYYIYSLLEKEVFAMLPLSRRNNEYCRPLTKLKIDLSLIQKNRNYYIDKYYNDIILLLAQVDTYNTSISKKKDHPKGHKCGYDHSAHRYCWVNFIPAVFDTRGNGVQTIEFRLHSATTSYIKCKYWLLICIGLVDIVENHKNEIYDNSTINLHQVIKTVYPKNFLKLLDYVQKRTNKFASDDGNAELSDYTENEIDEQILIKNL